MYVYMLCVWYSFIFLTLCKIILKYFLYFIYCNLNIFLMKYIFYFHSLCKKKKKKNYYKCSIYFNILKYILLFLLQLQLSF